MALILAACGTSSSPQASPSASSEAAASPPPGCVNPPADITTLIWISPLTGQELYDPVACYGQAPLTFDVLLQGVGTLTCVTVVEPVWLSCPTASLWLVGEMRKLGVPQLFVSVDPAAAASLAEYLGTNVRVTGHYDDPAAQDCREVSRPPDGSTPEPAAEIIEGCRRVFVVTQVVPLDTPTGTLTVSPDAGVVDGPGMSVRAAIAAAPMPEALVNGWLLIDAFDVPWLCEELVEGTPPRCGGAQLRVANYGTELTPNFQEAEGVHWIADMFQLFGDVAVP